MKKHAAVTFLMATFIMGCEVEIDPNAYFPQDYETSFAKIGACRASADHSNPYYLLHVNATGKDAFMANMPLPEGTVLVKTQYNDKECTDLAVWTAMKKREVGYDPANADWDWQNITQDGEIKAQGKVAACSDCHKKCTGSLCTPP